MTASCSVIITPAPWGGETERCTDSVKWSLQVAAELQGLREETAASRAMLSQQAALLERMHQQTAASAR